VNIWFLTRGRNLSPPPHDLATKGVDLDSITLPIIMSILVENANNFWPFSYRESGWGLYIMSITPDELCKSTYCILETQEFFEAIPVLGYISEAAELECIAEIAEGFSFLHPHGLVCNVNEHVGGCNRQVEKTRLWGHATDVKLTGWDAELVTCVTGLDDRSIWLVWCRRATRLDGRATRLSGHETGLGGLLSRAWSILDYTGLATLYLTFGRGEGSLTVGVRREEADDHIGAIYGVYIHTESITVTAV
jgi:hypothetical protein